MMQSVRKLATILLGLGISSGGALAAGPHTPFTYEVTITNVTPGQTFTPQLLATHGYGVRVFELGQPASAGLELLAEGGDTSGVAGELEAAGGRVAEMLTIPGLLEPGQSVSMTIKAGPRFRYLSLAAMLVPTNDTFVALDAVHLPRVFSRTYDALAYDAGTEHNDQNCLNIPGPRCGGDGYSPGPNVGDEGFVHVSNGFHDLASDGAEGEVLGPATYDWRNPVARIVVKRVR